MKGVSSQLNKKISFTNETMGVGMWTQNHFDKEESVKDCVWMRTQREDHVEERGGRGINYLRHN